MNDALRSVSVSEMDRYKSPAADTGLRAYIDNEVQQLLTRQKHIQESIQNKNKEITSLRETLLVVSGALQGLQHVQAYVPPPAQAPEAPASGQVVVVPTPTPTPTPTTPCQVVE